MLEYAIVIIIFIRKYAHICYLVLENTYALNWRKGNLRLNIHSQQANKSVVIDYDLNTIELAWYWYRQLVSGIQMADNFRGIFKNRVTGTLMAVMTWIPD